jgi:spermidine synthase
VLLVVAVCHPFLARNGLPAVRVATSGDNLARRLSRPLLERWNELACVRVLPWIYNHPLSFGLSQNLPSQTAEQLLMTIDASAATPIVSLKGGMPSVQYLKYDVANFVHYLRSGADVMVVGAGGGCDVLSALVFNQKSVTAVEINKNIVDVTTKTLSDFSGHLERDPKVRFVVDDARSYLNKSAQRYDIIGANLLETWAASAAGAFSLSESSLYTTEAWELMLSRLTEHGILSFTRLYKLAEPPDDGYRMVSLAAQALKDMGVNDPRRHIIIVSNGSLASFLICKDAFSKQDIDTADEAARNLGFKIILSPEKSADPIFTTLVSGDSSEFIKSFKANISATTDDNPFFFQTVRLSDALKTLSGQDAGLNDTAVGVLVVLLMTVTVLSISCIALPLIAIARSPIDRQERASIAPVVSMAAFFACIGCGFMFVEVSLIQRLTIFLGHPSYGLCVVLFTLLLASGVGSCLSGLIKKKPRVAIFCLSAIVAGIFVECSLLNLACSQFQGASTTVRMTVAVLLIFPLGVFIGTAFPLGMAAAARTAPNLTPWLFAVNGAMSVFASVLAVVLALSFGLRSTLFFGASLYVLAVVAYEILNWQNERLSSG